MQLPLLTVVKSWDLLRQVSSPMVCFLR